MCPMELRYEIEWTGPKDFEVAGTEARMRFELNGQKVEASAAIKDIYGLAITLRQLGCDPGPEVWIGAGGNVNHDRAEPLWKAQGLDLDKPHDAGLLLMAQALTKPWQLPSAMEYKPVSDMMGVIYRIEEETIKEIVASEENVGLAVLAAEWRAPMMPARARSVAIDLAYVEKKNQGNKLRVDGCSE